MILGFAHITRNQSGWPPDTDSEVIENPPAKYPLMERHAKRQAIMLGRRTYTIATEVAQYDTGVVDHHLNRLDVGRDRVILTARKPTLEMDFFIRGLGLENGATWVGITSHVLRWSVKILVAGDAVAPLDPPLDVAGYAALAFFSTDVEADRDRAIAAGGRTPTEPFTVKLDRKMQIIMLRSPEGTIIELIEVMR